MATTTTTGAMATSTACGTPAQYEIPVQDASCGVPNTDKYEGLISKCAKPAGVTSYNHDCAIYALAVDQSIQELTDCLYEAGVAWEDVWCHGETNATATATSYPTATRMETSTSNADRTSSGDSTSSGTSTDSAATSTNTSESSASLPKAHTSLKAVMLLSTLFASAVFIRI
ncbi:uncharacterized protein N7479_011363 [Penicillium vulpinum]|uniref:Uncharacterized protein n=1 Tax=Penicillium vulpinum TaxID=29845 RepID=A0A1V6RXW5_9EURO|nr:uncharacterized protein N7479_011363 [Penicillium vulpinum]KAJ5952950.1 hypothetical protein N7479_011363 [Penicillium vulpinum]OQE06329.1 hypothetical protein PENVUL_c018G05287 [Penicillium vulpinum]